MIFLLSYILISRPLLSTVFLCVFTFILLAVFSRWNRQKSTEFFCKTYRTICYQITSVNSVVVVLDLRNFNLFILSIKNGIETIKNIFSVNRGRYFMVNYNIVLMYETR